MVFASGLVIAVLVFIAITGTCSNSRYSCGCDGIKTIPFVPHPEVVPCRRLAFIARYAKHVIEPKAVASGLAPITRRQKRWYFAALISMWLASDWPVHDVA
ncbi:MAG: hypothetical protein R2706_18760 [Acidimicrobiales bacterium]